MAATNSAPSRRYSPASDAITTTSDRALLMGCRCTSRLTAPATQIPPKNRNKIRCMSVYGPDIGFQGHHERGYDQIRNRCREQKLPAKRHQLVIAEAGKRPANPDIEKHEEENLQAKPHDRQNSLHQGRTAHRAQP